MHRSHPETDSSATSTGSLLRCPIIATHRMLTSRRKLTKTLALLAHYSGYCHVYRLMRHRTGDFRVFIFEYHDVGPPLSDKEGTVSTPLFVKQVESLQRYLRLTSLTDSVARLRAAQSLDEDLAVLTFDDGYVGNFEYAWPELEQRRLRPCFFLTTGFLDGSELWFDRATRLLSAALRISGALPTRLANRLKSDLESWPTVRNPMFYSSSLKRLHPSSRNRLLDEISIQAREIAPSTIEPMTWDQVREMHRAGAEFGAHTVTHPILSRISPREQEGEIRQSTSRIREELGDSPRLFAYPNGASKDFTRDTVKILKTEKFLGACTTIRGSNSHRCDPFRLKRIGVGSDLPVLLHLKQTPLYEKLASNRVNP